jgi:hypothetical protein
MCFVIALCAGTMAVIKLEGPPQLCKTDEVGELCLSANYCGTGYWGLQGVSNSIFKVVHVFSFLLSAVINVELYLAVKLPD